MDVTDKMSLLIKRDLNVKKSLSIAKGIPEKFHLRATAHDAKSTDIYAMSFHLLIKILLKCNLGIKAKMILLSVGHCIHTQEYCGNKL